MILALNIGNTYTIAGCMEGDKVVREVHLKTDPQRTDSEYAVMLSNILSFEGVNTGDITGAIIASVVPPLTAVMKEAVRRLIGVSALVVGSGIKTGLNIGIDDPAQLGSDLVVGAVAATASYPAPIIIVDMNTATTFTVIDGRKRLLGGAIVPGVRVSLDGLSRSTSQLPRVPLEAPKSCIGSNTVECMKSGIVYGTAAQIDGLIDRMEDELGEKATLVATGPASATIVPHCRHDITCDSTLILRGLAMIYAKNRK